MDGNELSKNNEIVSGSNEINELQSNFEGVWDLGVEEDVEAPDLKLGMTFRNHTVFRVALKECCIQRGFDYRYLHNDKKRITIRPTHQCSMEEINRLVDSRYLCDKYLDDLRYNLNIPNDAFMERAFRELSSRVSRFQAYRTKKKAEIIGQGDFKAQYRFVRDYCNMILFTNEGSTACVGVEVVPPKVIDGIPQQMSHTFERMYVCFNALKVGFLSGCRPIIGIDGCHLKGPIGGHILSAISLDGNDNMYPIAIAVVEAETKNSWKWFLDLLHRDIGHTNDKNWVWISDKQKGLVEVFDEEMPYAEHRFCVKHLYENFRKEFKGKEYKEAFWVAARANTIKEWEVKMKNLQKMDNGKAFAWLMKFNPTTWTRSHMSAHSKCDLLVNNVYREEGMQKYPGPICPNIQGKLEKIKVDGRTCKATAVGILKYEIEGGGPTRTVDLAAKVCSCRQWDIIGIPCKRAVACIWKNRENPEDYVDSCYSKATFLDTYKVKMVPIPGMDEWESVGLNPVEAPIIREPPGRPRKVRKKAVDEPRNPYKVSRRNKPVKCGNCNQEGHNSRGCRAAVTGETTWQRRMRKQAEKRVVNVPSYQCRTSTSYCQPRASTRQDYC
ncbi:hypothetical protein SLEP1_g19207 [Rubroshorea leprosula]|nr:hypothetical protein SLEP1_g19207 [Rubroshorea leprosula]